ncbi:hypothetical protein [Streptomyces xanthochromogenes]|uniref:DUF3618 domain-containing protein n=1 Tax=Streptomyces xanthochromogenes TaxID=67384 RepID=A0ABQ2ZCY8_9ACTN|nr:hypothetical protein [Streptomyces xanthochromogenes]GGY12945.1 hypothetical protein GCM10010326_00080 [Streptomyces xanthochromogenes]
MSAPTQDPTPWELLRAMQQMRDDLRADFAVFTDRLTEMVTKIQYDADRRTDDLRLKALESEVAEIRRDRERERLETRANRRLAITALIAPVLVGVLVAALVGQLTR